MKQMLQSPVGRLRLIGIAEGISLLVLLFIAMPLKYMAGKPELVKYTGWAHGILFVAFMLAVALVWLRKAWPFKTVLLAFVAAFVPFGTFWFDARLKREAQKA